MTKRTLDYFNQNFPDGLLVKTHKFIAYITYDLDILIPGKIADYQFEDLKKRRHPGKQNKFQKNYLKNDLLKIDLHEDFYWQGYKFVDTPPFFKTSQKVIFFGQKTEIPDYTLEFLLNCAHILFERRYITLLDFDYLRRLVKEKKVVWQLVKSQAKKYGWEKSLKILLEVIEVVHRELFDQEALLPKQLKIAPKKLRKKELVFPVFLSWREIIKIYKEKYLFDKKLTWGEMSYYLLARARGWLGIKTRYPYYLHWFDFKKLEKYPV
jgi:hypothetical protein